MSRKTKEEAERTHTRIIASALSLFVKKGYERTTFNDIAARLKMTKGAVYWHFESKEALLVALVEEMRQKFQRQLEELMPKDELTFPAVAKMMVSNATRIVQEPKGTAFFMLMKTQIRWGSESMAKTREALLSNQTGGPYHAFVRAIETDKAAGRVRPEINPEAVASVCLAMWDGLVQAKIEKLLSCPLERTLDRSYQAVWESIRITDNG